MIHTQQDVSSSTLAPVSTCLNCGYPIQKDINISLLGGPKRIPILCPCKDAELKALEAQDEQRRIQQHLDRFKAYSLIDNRFEHSTFELWEHNPNNQKLFELAKKYADNWDEMFSNNAGLVLHGDAGTGKTFAAFAIANELGKKNISVMAVSISALLSAIKDSYSRNGDIGEQEVFRAITDASLLILDDMGTEHKTSWAYDKLYSIIDNRWRAKKPLIITTNLSIDGLRSNLTVVDGRKGEADHSERIWSRIDAMCIPYRVNGPSWRIKQGNAVSEIIRKLETIPVDQ